MRERWRTDSPVRAVGRKRRVASSSFSTARCLQYTSGRHGWFEANDRATAVRSYRCPGT